MHAWQFESHGNYQDVLHWMERAAPTPGREQALIRTTAVSLNFPDLLIIQGMYQHKAPLPAVPGVEAVGIVEAVGPASKFKIGERVVGFSHSGGTLADLFLVNNTSAWTVPAHVSDEQAAALSVVYGTSYFGLEHRAQLKAGENLLVLGAAGGVGLAAIQLGRLMGAKVIACAGDPKKLEVCAQQGAHHLINYKTEDLVERVKALTNGHGADVVLLEAAARSGGTIGSAHEQGCLIEAGPSSTLDTTLLIAALLDTTGTPCASASTGGKPKPSAKLGKRNTLAFA